MDPENKKSKISRTSVETCPKNHNRKNILKINFNKIQSNNNKEKDKLLKTVIIKHKENFKKYNTF